ncbi:MAG: YebC/PmpR family DNA-binding transcriptional regulator [Chloroflexi bacterium]|nr:YebC/PmpR family DNA-binding transcriptional regulator [Chloroflexota bacterium]
MSGHSKWSTIKRKKGTADAKRGTLFTKLAREIQIAARESPDPAVNFKLRLAVDKARATNMPKDNIERAIQRGAGLEKGEDLEEIMYEGYGPHGVALLVQVVTDNRNRTLAEVRHMFSKSGGSLGEQGCVAWQFQPKGYITLTPDDHDPFQLFEWAVEAGAEDVAISEDLVEVYTALEDFKTVQDVLLQRGVEAETAEIYWSPSNTISLGAKPAFQNMTLINGLEELDDVAQVYSNLDITDEFIAQFEAAS